MLEVRCSTFNFRVKAIFLLNEGRGQGLRFFSAVGPASKGHQIEQGLSGVFDCVFNPGWDDQIGMEVSDLFLLDGFRTFILPDDQEGAAAKKEPFGDPGKDVISPDGARFQGDDMEGSPFEGRSGR